VAASWALPWMRASLPMRYGAKVVAAAQGIVLLAASSQLLPAPGTTALLGAALGAVSWSFGLSVAWLWRHARA